MGNAKQRELSLNLQHPSLRGGRCVEFRVVTHGPHISIERQSLAYPRGFTSQSAYPKQREVKVQWETLSQNLRRWKEGDFQHPPLWPLLLRTWAYMYTHIPRTNQPKPTAHYCYCVAMASLCLHKIPSLTNIRPKNTTAHTPTPQQ